MYHTHSHHASELEVHRSSLMGHCYRMLGSVVDAEDATQESMLRAWKSLDGFNGRCSFKTWLHRMATNVCLDKLSDRGRRERPFETGNPSSGSPPIEELVQRDRVHWLEPIPDAYVIPPDADPEERIMLKQSIRLAFITALQHLAPKQRAALLLKEVVGLSVAEVAEILETTVPAINSALQRARAALAQYRAESPKELSAAQCELLKNYLAAFEVYDTERLVSLLREDAILNMPPFSMWIRGRREIHAWLNGIGNGCRGSRLFSTEACGLPAFAQYRLNPKGGHKAHALITLELDGDLVATITSFLDVETLFPRFDFPLTSPVN
jgi:RNA polymerase sigma-70 factor, ECF subfamily